MSIQETPKTACELGLMSGYPPAPEGRVTHENQLLAPYNRWSFQHELPLNRVADVWRGSGPASTFETASFDMSQVSYQNRLGATISFDQMVDLSYTDGILVLQRGKIIYERYLNDMRPHTLHAWASGSKSVTGVLAMQLAQEGEFDPSRTVAAYLPELKNSGFGDATLQQVLDMTAAVKFANPQPDAVSEDLKYAIALGWRERPAGYTGPSSVYEILPTLVKAGAHGQRFSYETWHTDVLAWLMKRLLGQSLAEITQECLWAKLGADRDAFWIVDPSGAETSGSGLVTTLRDMARFGQMLLQKGWFNGQQIVAEAAIIDLEQGSDPAAFARGLAAGPGNQGWSYHNQWWHTHNDHRAYMGIGYGGQILYIDPLAEMVIAKFSSYPTPTPAGNEFYSAFAAFPALGRALG